MYLRQSTASQEVLLGPFLSSTDGNTTQTGLTIANTDIKVWKHGATSEASKNSGGATHISAGRYYAVLDATDTDTLGNLELNMHIAGALPVRREFTVLPANVFDSLILGSDLLDVNASQLGGTNQGAGDMNAKLDTIDDFLDTEIAAIKAKTDNLPSDPADASDIAAAFSAASAKLDTIDDFLDTEIAAIKAKTDLIPASPAAVDDIPTATENADALLKRDMSAVTGEAARSPLNALRFLRNLWTIVGTTLSVKKEDDSTEAWNATVSTNPAADPIVGSDPS